MQNLNSRVGAKQVIKDFWSEIPQSESHIDRRKKLSRRDLSIMTYISVEDIITATRKPIIGKLPMWIIFTIIGKKSSHTRIKFLLIFSYDYITF